MILCLSIEHLLQVITYEKGLIHLSLNYSQLKYFHQKMKSKLNNFMMQPFLQTKWMLLQKVDKYN